MKLSIFSLSLLISIFPSTEGFAPNRLKNISIRNHGKQHVFNPLTDIGLNHLPDFIHHIIPSSIELPEIDIVEQDTEGSSLNPLGKDLLVFLFSTIGIVPLFKWLNASPVIGFLTAGLIMGPAGLHLFSDLNDMESIADFGVLFLLFEQGLELTVERLQGLSKYAFGMGTLQVILCTAAFFLFPFIGGVQFLEFFFGSQPDLVNITRLDEALVIGLALSLSSSAFCLKILQEKNQLSTNFGAASLGILLLQDIAVVPLLVLLPIIESSTGSMSFADQAAILGVTFAKALFGLGGILLFGGRIVRFMFSLVAQSRSSETFVALCLLVALGTGALTDWLGLSSTLGAFTAGTLLAESNYRTQIESDIKPFRGLLLGLFFITTGASVQPNIIQDELPTVLALLAGLITFKAVIISSLGPLFQLTRTESIRTGMLLSGGGEFAFVVLTLADKLHVLPDKLAKILVGVVVISMALTPYLSNFGDVVAGWFEKMDQENNVKEATRLFDSVSNRTSLGELATTVPLGSTEPSSTSSTTPSYNSHDNFKNAIVICGFNNLGSNIASFLSDTSFQKALKLSETATVKSSSSSSSSSSYTDGYTINSDSRKKEQKEQNERREQEEQDKECDILNYVAFDLDPNVVIREYRKGQNVLYGDGCQPLVLLTAGISNPRAFVITYTEQEERLKAVEKLRQAYPNTPIISRTSEVGEYYQLMEAGANSVCIQEREASYNMFTSLLSSLNIQIPQNKQTESLGIMSTDQYMKNLRENNEKEDFEYLQARLIEKSTWSQDLLSTRVNIPDSTYFETFKKTLSQTFIFTGLTPSVNAMLEQMSQRLSDVLGSSKLTSDDDLKVTTRMIKTKLNTDSSSTTSSNTVDKNKSESSNTKESTEVSTTTTTSSFSNKNEGVQIEIVERKTTVTTTDNIMKILTSNTNEDQMGVTICPLPTIDVTNSTSVESVRDSTAEKSKSSSADEKNKISAKSNYQGDDR